MENKTVTSSITLKGSARLVAEFFGYSVNTIQYQRGIYDTDSFTTVARYGLKMQITTDKLQLEYQSQEEWLITGEVRKQVLVQVDLRTKETLERWAFDVQTDEDVLQSADEVAAKDPNEVQREIAAIVRQITASVTFLPIIETSCSFDLLVYTHRDTNIPNNWEISDPQYISCCNEVK